MNTPIDDVTSLVNSKVLPHLPEEDKKTITLSVILDIATAIISLFRSCPAFQQSLHKDEAAAMAKVRNPGLFGRLRLRLAVARQLRSSGNSANVGSVVNGVLAASAGATKDDILKVCSAASSE